MIVNNEEVIVSVLLTARLGTRLSQIGQASDRSEDALEHSRLTTVLLDLRDLLDLLHFNLDVRRQRSQVERRRRWAAERLCSHG